MQIPVETWFARTLAANEKKLRDQGVCKLREWLSARTSSAETSFTEEELMKLWKGLFYCMWMSDKPLIQEELATAISDMIHCFSSTESALLFIDCFFKTMNREWFGLDQWRVDKFMMFVRKFLNQSFCLVKRLRWEDEVISALLNVLKKTVLSASEESVNFGLQLHVADIYVEELAKVASKRLSGNKLTAFFVPYCHFLIKTNIPALQKTIATRVFEFAIRLSDFDADSKMNDVEDLEDDDEEEYEEDSDDEDDDDTNNLDVEAKWRKIIKRHEIKAQQLPFPNFDYKGLGDKLLEIVGKYEGIKGMKLKWAHIQVKNLYETAKGMFPLDAVADNISDSDDDEELTMKAADKLIKFEEKLFVDSLEYKAEKKKKGKKRKAELFSEVYDLDENKPEKILEEQEKKKLEEEEKGKEVEVSKRKRKKMTKNDDDRDDSEAPICDKLMQRLLRKAAEKKSQNHKETEDKAGEQPTTEKMTKKKKRQNERKKTSNELPQIKKDYVAEEIHNDSSEQSMTENKEETIDDKPSIIENGDEPVDEIIEVITSDTKKTRDRIEDSNMNGTNRTKKPQKLKAVTKTLAKNLKQKSRYYNSVFAEQLRDDDGKTETLKIKDKKKMKKKKARPSNSPSASDSQALDKFVSFTKSPPAFFSNAVMKISPKKAKKKKVVASNVTNGSARKVNFVLTKNLEHEMTDYAVSIRSSPAIPFDARKLPSQGVLKATSATTPARKSKRATAKLFF